MGPVKHLSQGPILPQRGASLHEQPVQKQPRPERPSVATLPRQQSFRCLDAMLCETATEQALVTASPVSPQLATPDSDGEKSGRSLRQLFRKKPASPPPARESFFCEDARLVEEAYFSSRDRYEGAARAPEPSAPAPTCVTYAPPQTQRSAYPAPPARSLMAEALAERARRAAQAQAPAGRPPRRPAPELQAPPPVPPLPEQYRRRGAAHRI